MNTPTAVTGRGLHSMRQTHRTLITTWCLITGVSLGLTVLMPAQALRAESALPNWPLQVEAPHISTDPSVKYDYPIVYVRAPKFIQRGDRQVPSAWSEFGHPTKIDPGYDLMLLHPDGTEEVLVEGGQGAVTDPFVSFDGESVYYSYHHDPDAGEWTAGADIYRIHVPTRDIVRLTHQELTPNTGVADWASDLRTPEQGKTHLNFGVYNLGPCPVPGGKVAFVSNRDGFKTPRGYPRFALQLFVMDEDGRNVQKIGHLNVAGALHPVILTDGRILFSSLESQGIRNGIQWGIWSIHPDGSNWEPVVSAFHGANGFHFQSQLSDGSIVVENYYNQNNRGFGTHLKLPLRSPQGAPGFLAGDTSGVDGPRMRMLGATGRWTPLRLPFQPDGLEVITRFAHFADRSASLSDPDDPQSPYVGKVIHPSGAPDNHLLTVWTSGSTPNANGPVRGGTVDAGIYLIKDGQPIDEPGQMLRIKHDPDYNAQFPRALVSYKRIYGIDEPHRLPTAANDGRQSPQLPAGSPFGLVGTSSLYKRESFPGGVVPEGSVTATYKSPQHMLAVFTQQNAFSNWNNQGSDAGLYDNSDIHAIRILAMEPATAPLADRFYNFAHERLRILGEVPVRKFNGEVQPVDPDGNPDTSFLAKIPADVAFTFQMIDKDGMNLTMAQTWHQVRPGEVRHDCGGCHSHSQLPTPFELTAAARPDYAVWDLTSGRTPLVTSKSADETGRQWDRDDAAGVRWADGGVHNVEYFRDVRPIFERSCVACHTRDSDDPAGGLVLDADDQRIAGPRFFPGDAPGTYFRLALDHGQRPGRYTPEQSGGSDRPNGQPLFGPIPEGRHSQWRFPLASRYVAKFQSRRSLLIWKVFGRRTDGLPESMQTPDFAERHPQLMIDYNSGIMPPPEAVASGKVQPLSDEDRLTLVRWIDLGCPIDLDYDPARPSDRGRGWMLDDQRPTLTLTAPQPGSHRTLSHIRVGMHDYDSGLDLESFLVIADFPVDGIDPGRNLAGRFQPQAPGVWELQLAAPITELPQGTLTVSVKDRQGNLNRIERTFAVGMSSTAP